MKFTIVGGGFGGVKTALELSKHKHNHITLITDKPDFQYYPALYGNGNRPKPFAIMGPVRADICNSLLMLSSIKSKKVDPAKNSDGRER